MKDHKQMVLEGLAGYITVGATLEITAAIASFGIVIGGI
jgi:hypothetical protein